MITTHQFIRKAFYVDATQVTGDNMAAIAEWCGGKVRSFEPKPKTEGELQKVVMYIDVPVIRPAKIRQTQAFVGDWVLRAPNRSFKVYTHKAFRNEFSYADSVEPSEAA